MMPFHFGAEQRLLFGIYEPALYKPGKKRAVLLCYPMGNEQIFAYRTIRQLAARLAGVGFHVLRFDYFGTGDSYGDTNEGDIASWSKDIETAIDELRDMTAVAQVSLVGLRLGANLASQIAAKRSSEIAKLVLWDPLAADELATVALERMASQGNHFTQSKGTSRAEEIAPVDITYKTASPSRNRLLILTTRPPKPKEIASFEVFYRVEDPAWIEERVVSGTIPSSTLQHIVGWLK
jgi:pimeloyl-ACP methyl ester carboxylesterase